MNKNLIILAAACAVLFMSCNKESLPDSGDVAPVAAPGFVSKVSGRQISYDAVRKGSMMIKVREDIAGSIEAFDGDIMALTSEVKSVAAPFSKLGIKSVERVFPYAGEFEERTRKAGLHRWYRVEFAEGVSLQDAEEQLHGTEGVETVDFDYLIGCDYRKVEYPVTILDVPVPADAAVFNDPYLSMQWHYQNTGAGNGHIAGCDINVVPVWEAYATGNESVIVSVVDGGVDCSHVDLAPNIWTDPDNGSHGYNFVYNTYAVTADDHGTHVAGTVAAVNNNGVGVCGVAGGDYAHGVPGVRIMSCQIFATGPDGKDVSGPGHTAIKWGADHGAIISQNSWGYTDATATPSYLTDAVDYFNQYAGCDNSGNQLPDSPMKGGVVIFAAGNDNMNIGYPSEYDGVIAVSSVAADFQRAYYSNYGNWCDIIAPGGDAYKNQLVLSTLPGDDYGYMQGTSMACPHVSGVAALIVSNMGGPGFTADKLKELLLGGVDETVLGYNTLPLGAGMVNASNSIAFDRPIEHTIEPEIGNSLSMKPSQTRQIVFSVKNPTGHPLSLSLEPQLPGFTVSRDPANPSKRIIVEVNGPEAVGDNWDRQNSFNVRLKATCPKEPGEEYSCDFSVVVDANQSPVILRPLSGIVADRVGESIKIALGNSFFDSDGDAISYSIGKTSLGTFTVQDGIVSFVASSYGVDEVEVTASDLFGASVSAKMKILVRDGALRELDFYPNPVVDKLHIRASSSFDARVIILSVDGRTVYDGNATIDPFSPAEIDMSSFAGGVYTVKVTSSAKGVDITSTIVKI